MEYGRVYLLTNSYMPGLVKIGMTKQENIDKRMKVLYIFGAPFVSNCELVCRLYNMDCVKIEKTLNAIFEPHQVIKNRESFKVSSPIGKPP